MTQDVTKVWPAILIACTILFVLNTCIIFYAVSDNSADADLATVEANIVALEEKIDSMVAVEEIAVEDVVAEEGDATDMSFTLTKSEYEDELTEATALELATDSVMSRDFKKAVYDLLVLELRDIEDYKDITEIRILDADVDDDEVTFDVKVYYLIDGDEDETERARLDEFDVIIDDLDFDDDFDDAEVDDDYMDSLVLLNVYD